MITWEQLKEKFLDKGFSFYEFQILVPQPMLFDPDCVSLSYSTREDLLKRHKKNNTTSLWTRVGILEYLN